MIRKDRRLEDYVRTGQWTEDVHETIVTISGMAKDIHSNAISKGWWETRRPVPELLCLIHSEVSEALEAYRKQDEKNLAEELADIVIRAFDMAEGLGIDIEKEITTKHEYNKTREYRHGGKKC
jgi:NTP pyrophosphatase (non-canonical NTP hydrolase)